MKSINLAKFFKRRVVKRTLGGMMTSAWVSMVFISIMLLLASAIFHFFIFYELNSESFIKSLGVENAEYKNVNRGELLRFVGFANEKKEKVVWGEIKKSTTTATSTKESIDRN